MSKLSFRARALDASKPMFIYKADEIPDLPDFAAINRAVPQMPTGMEKEEETEHHLQRALSAQQVYGTSEAREIPVPDVSYIDSRYCDLYKPKNDYKPPKQYIHVQPWGMDQEIPDYDMDSEDEQWLLKQAKNLKMEVTPIKFENMMDRLEKGSGQTVVTLQEAKALLKEDDDLTIAVYDYWLNKRLRLQHPLIPAVKTEKRDGSTTNNPYVAFRRRTEKMQTRKNRKNDEASYEKMLKLRRDLNKALTILEMMKRREKSKKELLQLTIEVMDKRYQMEDWEGNNLAEAMAQRHKLPAFIPLQNFGRGWEATADGSFVKKKREYKKRKHKQQASTSNAGQQATVQLPQYNEVDVLHPDFTSDDDAVSPPMSPSDQEVEDDPDGVYAFKRKSGCSYHAPIGGSLGNWPWCGPDEGGFGEKKYRFSLASITQPRRCLGFVRRRTGRGGRILLDRAVTPWDDYLSELDVSSPVSGTGWVAEYTNYIKENKISHFRPRTPTEELVGGSGLRDSLSPLIPTEFNVESFQNHQEQLLQMQQQQQEQLLKQETDLALDTSFDMEHSFSSQPTSRFTLDSASAQFAASALCNSAQELAQQVGLSIPSGANSSAVCLSETIVPVTAVTNGPIIDSKASGLSTSPAANVLQLNFPLTPSTADCTLTRNVSSSSLLSSSVQSSSLPSVSIPIITQGTSSGIQATPPIATKAVPVATKSLPSASSSTLLRQNNTAIKTQSRPPTENHDGVNSIVKNEVVAMEVT